MPGTKHILAGEMTENGRTIAQGTLSVFVTDYYISLRECIDGMHRGQELLVQPFSTQMFRGAAAENGYKIEMQGNQIGSYKNGPLGHPADGEFEIYDLLMCSIAGTYRKEGLCIEIAVNTGQGREVCFRANEESRDTLKPISATVKFLVPKDGLKEFLGFDDGSVKTFMAKFEAAG